MIGLLRWYLASALALTGSSRLTGSVVRAGLPRPRCVSCGRLESAEVAHYETLHDALSSSQPRSTRERAREMTSAFDSAVLRDFHLVAWLVLERPDGTVLLAKRAGVRYGEGLWGLPGGHVENGESLIDAAIRELREEVGVVAQASHVQPLGVTRYAEGDIWGADFFFLTRHWAGEPAPIAQCSEVAWHAPTALPRGTLPWLGRALRSHLLEDRWFDESV